MKFICNPCSKTCTQVNFIKQTMTAALIVQNQVDYLNCLTLSSQQYTHTCGIYSQGYIYLEYIRQPLIFTASLQIAEKNRCKLTSLNYPFGYSMTSTACRQLLLTLFWTPSMLDASKSVHCPVTTVINLIEQSKS